MNPVRCRDCVWFRPYEHHPVAAMGECMHENKHGYWNAGVQHRCRDHEDSKESDDG